MKLSRELKNALATMDTSAYDRSILSIAREVGFDTSGMMGTEALRAVVSQLASDAVVAENDVTTLQDKLREAESYHAKLSTAWGENWDAVYAACLPLGVEAEPGTTQVDRVVNCLKTLKGKMLEAANPFAREREQAWHDVFRLCQELEIWDEYQPTGIGKVVCGIRQLHGQRDYWKKLALEKNQSVQAKITFDASSYQGGIEQFQQDLVSQMNFSGVTTKEQAQQRATASDPAFSASYGGRGNDSWEHPQGVAISLTGDPVAMDTDSDSKWEGREFGKGCTVYRKSGGPAMRTADVLVTPRREVLYLCEWCTDEGIVDDWFASRSLTRRPGIVIKPCQGDILEWIAKAFGVDAALLQKSPPAKYSSIKEGHAIATLHGKLDAPRVGTAAGGFVSGVGIPYRYPGEAIRVIKGCHPSHELYKTGDADAPEQIKDRNGEVVLSQCRNCGRAESELLNGIACIDQTVTAYRAAYPDVFRAWRQVYTRTGPLAAQDFSGLEDRVASTPYRAAVNRLAQEFEPERLMVVRRLLCLSDLCHGLANKAGWWIDTETGEDVRNWPKKFMDLWISAKLMLVVTEVAEAMEGHRKGLMDDKLPHRGMFEVELADALIRIADLAGGLNLDLAGAVIEKLAYNLDRADHKLENRKAAGGKSV